MAKAQLKVTNKCTSELGTVVMHTVELIDADGVMKEYGIKDYHDDNGIFDTEIEDIETGEDIYINSTLGKRIIDALDEEDINNDNTSSFGNDIDDAHYDKYADDPNLEVQMNQDEDFEAYHANLGKLNNNPPLHKDDNISVSEKVNHFLADLGIIDEHFEDQIHTLIIHYTKYKHEMAQFQQDLDELSDERDSMTYEDAHVNHDIVVPCSAELDNQMYNESI
jgi:hypothetical protein